MFKQVQMKWFILLEITAVKMCRESLPSPKNLVCFSLSLVITCNLNKVLHSFKWYSICRQIQTGLRGASKSQAKFWSQVQSQGTSGFHLQLNQKPCSPHRWNTTLLHRWKCWLQAKESGRWIRRWCTTKAAERTSRTYNNLSASSASAMDKKGQSQSKIEIHEQGDYRNIGRWTRVHHSC